MNPIIYNPAAQDERAELLAWLEHNRATLAKYDAHEIGHFAQMNFDNIVLVSQVVPEWVRSRDTHTTYKIREDWHVTREIQEAHRQTTGEPGLQEQWMAVANKQEFDQDFENAV